MIERPMINATTGSACPGFCTVVDMDDADACTATHHGNKPMMSHTGSHPDMGLPTELVDSLNQTYFLHLLVNDKDKVVPPGKSVLSMLMHSNFRLGQESDKQPEADLVERVTEAAHKAFWKEVSGRRMVFMCSHWNYVLGNRSTFVSDSVCTTVQVERIVSGSSRSAWTTFPPESPYPDDSFCSTISNLFPASVDSQSP